MGANATQPLANRPSGKLGLSADQLDLVSGNWTQVLLNQIGAGFNDGIEDIGNSEIDIARPGFYLIAASLEFKNVVADKEYHIEIRQNGNAFAGADGYNKTSVNRFKLSCFYFGYLGIAYDFTLYAMSEAGVNTVDISSSMRTSLWVQRMR